MKFLQLIFIAACITAPGVLTAQQQFLLEEKTDSILASQRRADSLKIGKLKTKLENNTNNRATVDLLNELSQLYFSFLYDTAVLYSQKAQELAEQIDYDEGVVTAIVNRGYVEEIIKNNWDVAIVYYRNAIETARERKLEEMLDDLFSIIHNAYVYQGNFPMAMTIANEGIEAARKRNDRVQLLHYSSLVAASYFRQHLYDKALDEYKKAEILANNLGNEERSALNLVTVADIFYSMGEVYTALGDRVKAMFYLDTALAAFAKMEKDTLFIRHYMISNTLFKKGIAERTFGNTPKALQFALAALDSCRNGGCNPYERAGYYILAGDALRQVEKYDEAERYLYQGKRIAEKIRHAENARDAYYYLSLFYAGKKMFDSAWHYNQRYTLLKDSIINERTTFQTAEINTVYRIAEKDRQIARQNNLRNILIALFVVLFLTLIFLYNRYRLQQKNRYQKELNRQQNELFNAIAAAQDQERKRIAQDIHDSLGAILSAAKLRLSALKDSEVLLSEDQREKYQTSLQLLDEASSELRNISHNIMPATLSKLGLVAALKNLSDSISSVSGLQINFSAHDFTERIEEDMEISIYRIVLELINNVVKHALAGKVIVQLIKYPDHINITVEDNGRGFEYLQALQEKKGIGLGNILSRVDYLKGTINVDAVPGRGTTVIIDVPLGKQVA